MTFHAISLTLHIPQALVRALGTPHSLQGFLREQGLWPMRPVQQRWAIDLVTQGYVIELKVAVESDL